MLKPVLHAFPELQESHHTISIWLHCALPPWNLRTRLGSSGFLRIANPKTCSLVAGSHLRSSARNLPSGPQVPASGPPQRFGRQTFCTENGFVSDQPSLQNIHWNGTIPGVSANLPGQAGRKKAFGSIKRKQPTINHGRWRKYVGTTPSLSSLP